MSLVCRTLRQCCFRSSWKTIERQVRFASAPAEFLQKHSITVENGGKCASLESFQDDRLPSSLAPVLRRIGVEAPTPIQQMTIPNLLEGRDVVGIAATGSGKTLSFAIPGLMRIAKEPKYQDPYMLVIGPTRELVQQIAQAIQSVTNEQVATIFGGAPKSVQERQLLAKPRIVVGTPGRLMDFLKSGYLTLDNIRYLVLDEADRMLDMGFEPQIAEIMRPMSTDNRQTLLFSATWPQEVRHLAAEIVRNPAYIKIGSSELHANPNVEQRFVTDLRGPNEKLDTLHRVLDEHPNDKTVVFCNTKSVVDLVAMRLSAGRRQVLSVHGDKNQQQRDGVLHKFRAPGNTILVCTDVYARGLDIRDIQVVVNYDMPNTAEPYIHRIGRTGRAGASGVAYSLIDYEVTQNVLRDIINILQSNGDTPPTALVTAAQNARRGGKGSGRNSGYRQMGQARERWGDLGGYERRPQRGEGAGARGYGEGYGYGQGGGFNRRQHDYTQGMDYGGAESDDPFSTPARGGRWDEGFGNPRQPSYPRSSYRYDDYGSGGPRGRVARGGDSYGRPKNAPYLGDDARLSKKDGGKGWSPILDDLFEK